MYAFFHVLGSSSLKMLLIKFADIAEKNSGKIFDDFVWDVIKSWCLRVFKNSHQFLNLPKRGYFNGVSTPCSSEFLVSQISFSFQSPSNLTTSFTMLSSLGAFVSYRVLTNS